MEITRPSHWNLFLNCFDKNKSIKIVNEFLKQNPKIKPVGEVEYLYYWKLEAIQASFTCHQSAPAWPELVYDLILTTQGSATGLVFTCSIDESVDIFSNDVWRSKGSIRALSMVCDREDHPIENHE